MQIELALYGLCWLVRVCLWVEYWALRSSDSVVAGVDWESYTESIVVHKWSRGCGNAAKYIFILMALNTTISLLYQYHKQLWFKECKKNILVILETRTPRRCFISPWPPHNTPGVILLLPHQKPFCLSPWCSVIFVARRRAVSKMSPAWTAHCEMPSRRFPRIATSSTSEVSKTESLLSGELTWKTSCSKVNQCDYGLEVIKWLISVTFGWRREILGETYGCWDWGCKWRQRGDPVTQSANNKVSKKIIRVIGAVGWLDAGCQRNLYLRCNEQKTSKNICALSKLGGNSLAPVTDEAVCGFKLEQ